MNWNKIKEKHPKAKAKYIDWCHAEDCPSSKCYLHTTRDLYDFFDEQGIYINIFEAGILTGKIKDYENFRWIITTNFRTDKDAGKWEETTIYNHDYPLSKKITRTEAEEQAFTKAFEILESTL